MGWERLGTFWSLFAWPDGDRPKFLLSPELGVLQWSYTQRQDREGH